MSKPDLSPAVIDATDAVVLAPETAAPVLTERQTEELEKCEFHLHRLGGRIAARENDLIYLYIEAGWYMQRAQAVHRVSHDEKDGATGRFVATETALDGGFVKWLERPKIGVSKPTAYRYMQGAKRCGITAESNVLALQVLKEEKKLQGQTLAALCRKPVDKSDKEAEIHEVTDEEKEAERLADLKEAYRVSGHFLAEQVIADQTWADLSGEEIVAYEKLLADAHRAVKAGLKKAKALPAPAKKPTPHLWRVGQRTGQERWQVKQAPGWSVAHEADTIHQAAGWLRGQGVDLGTVDVLLAGGLRPTLDQHIETLHSNTESDGDRPCTQEDITRGLWWWGWIGFRGEVMLKTYTGDMKLVLEARGDPRIGKTVVGPFYAQYLADAEKIVREQDINAKI